MILFFYCLVSVEYKVGLVLLLVRLTDGSVVGRMDASVAGTEQSGKSPGGAFVRVNVGK